MKTVQVLITCLLLTGLPLVLVPVAEASGVNSSDIETNAESSAERETWAKSLFEGRCQMCHQLPEPSMLKPKQWRFILVTMQQRMQQVGVPPLTEDETKRLLEYLGKRAR